MQPIPTSKCSKSPLTFLIRVSSPSYIFLYRLNKPSKYVQPSTTSGGTLSWNLKINKYHVQVPPFPLIFLHRSPHKMDIATVVERSDMNYLSLLILLITRLTSSTLKHLQHPKFIKTFRIHQFIQHNTTVPFFLFDQNDVVSL